MQHPQVVEGQRYRETFGRCFEDFHVGFLAT